MPRFDAPITSPFGAEDSPLRTRPHTGVDYALPMGSTIRSLTSGTVEAVGDGGDFGLVVVVRLPDGSRVMYGHLSKAGVQLGQVIKEGDVLGASGSSGKSEGPHLHLQMWDAKGNLVDPEQSITGDTVPENTKLEKLRELYRQESDKIYPSSKLAELRARYYSEYNSSDPQEQDKAGATKIELDDAEKSLANNPLLKELNKAIGDLMIKGVLGESDYERAKLGLAERTTAVAEENLARQKQVDIIKAIQDDQDLALKEWDAYTKKHVDAANSMEALLRQVTAYAVPGPVEVPGTDALYQSIGAPAHGPIQPNTVDLDAIYRNLLEKIGPPPTHTPVDVSALNAPYQSSAPSVADFLAGLGGAPAPSPDNDQALEQQAHMLWDMVRRGGRLSSSLAGLLGR